MKHLLTSFVVSTTLALASFADAKPGFDVLARTYCKNDHHAIKIVPGTTAGLAFTSSDAFREVRLCCPSYSNNKGSLTLSLYRWAGSPAASRKTAPISRKRFVDFVDNAFLALAFDPCPPGRYYAELSDPEEQVGVWNNTAAITNVTTYVNGQRVAGALECAVLLCNCATPRSRLLGQTPPPSSECSAPRETTGVSDDSGALIPGRAFVERDLHSDTWDAIDGLGRVLSSHEKAGPPQKRQVGMFYWTWHTPTHGMPKDLTIPPYDTEKILRAHPALKGEQLKPHFAPYGIAHYWGEPVLGYYLLTDAWVSRRHAQMLAEAGVDAVVFDATNGHYTWMECAWTLMHTWADMRRDGFKTPKFVFMLPFGEQAVQLVSLLQLYRDIYKPGKFSDLWYYWDGRPLVHAAPHLVQAASVDPTRPEAERRAFADMLNFFTFRPLQAAYAVGPTAPDQWCWLEVYPQHGYGRRPDGSCEMCAAGVAQNHSWLAKDGHQGLAAMNDQNVFGRAYMGPSADELKPGERLHFAADRNPRRHEPNRFLWGDNFAQQLDHARKIDPSYLFITGWNEWIAGHNSRWMGLPGAFPDEYSPEFSRDLEPSAGIMQDHAYYQLVEGVRRFRGCRPQRAANENPVYRDARRDTVARDAIGRGQVRYVDATGRNDITDCAVTHTDTTIAFRVTCAAPITSYTDPDWMRLYISTSFTDAAPHWNHFQFLVNRNSPRNATTATLERCRGGWAWERVCDVALALEGNSLTLTIPRAALGCAGKKLDLRFKWTDHTTGKTEGDILDFYRHGDAAPDGRFVYRYFERFWRGWERNIETRTDRTRSGW